MARAWIARWTAGVALSVVTTAAIGRAQQPPAAPPQGAPAAVAGGRMVFTEPAPFDFNDHAGYVSLFDGVSLKGWDGNLKFWRVENGAIVGESTPTNPSGNSYIVYRDLVAKDFTLKFEIKVEGTGGSGIQYRSQTGLPWLANICGHRDRQRRAGQLELDDDGSTGRLLAEPRLYRTVLLREHADADSRLARTGSGGVRRAEQDPHGHDRRSRGARHSREG